MYTNEIFPIFSTAINSCKDNGHMYSEESSSKMYPDCLEIQPLISSRAFWLPDLSRCVLWPVMQNKIPWACGIHIRSAYVGVGSCLKDISPLYCCPCWACWSSLECPEHSWNALACKSLTSLTHIHHVSRLQNLSNAKPNAPWWPWDNCQGRLGYCYGNKLSLKAQLPADMVGTTFLILESSLQVWVTDHADLNQLVKKQIVARVKLKFLSSTLQVSVSVIKFISQIWGQACWYCWVEWGWKDLTWCDTEVTEVIDLSVNRVMPCFAA